MISKLKSILITVWRKPCVILFGYFSGWCPLGQTTRSLCQWCCHSGAKKSTKRLWMNSWHVEDLNWTQVEAEVQQVQTGSTVAISLSSWCKSSHIYQCSPHCCIKNSQFSVTVTVYLCVCVWFQVQIRNPIIVWIKEPLHCYRKKGWQSHWLHKR